MASVSPIRFQVDLARMFSERIRDYVRNLIDSKTLRDALTVIDLEEPGEAAVEVPHYWAVYYHDGRGPVRPRRGKYLVWFQSIEDDPRVDGGRNYPVRASQIRRLNLSRDQFQEMLDDGRLIMVTSAGPAVGKPFFEKLRGVAAGLVSSIAQREMSSHVRTFLAEGGIALGTDEVHDVRF